MSLYSITSRRTRQKRSLTAGYAAVLFVLFGSFGGCTPSSADGTTRSGKPLTKEEQARLDTYAKMAPDVLGPNSSQPSWVVGGNAGNIGPRGTPDNGKPVDTSWTILIESLAASTGQARATELLAQIQRAGVPEATLEQRNKTLVIAAGSYAGPSDPRATADLERIKTITLDGVQPFASAMLVPPATQAVAGSAPLIDLVNVRRRAGMASKALYTLQVGVYESGSGKDPTATELQQIRLTAEQAAGALRREGDDAYYYHGPRRSMITIGVFTDKDYSIRPRSDDSPIPVFIESSKIRMLKEKYPHNLVNGQAIKVRTRGQEEGRLQPSMIVEIPK